MNKDFSLLNIDIDSNIKDLHLDENFVLSICITNNSDFEAENGLFRLILDNSIFKIQDDKFKVLKNDFLCIENIGPNQTLNFDIPIKVININQSKSSIIMTILNFHIIENGKLIDLNCNSNKININFKENNNSIDNKSIISSDKNEMAFSQDCFIYTIDKHEGFDEDKIAHNIKLKNHTNKIVSNIVLTINKKSNIDFIKNTLSVNNIYRVGENINDSIILGELAPEEEFNITFDTYAKNQLENVSTSFKIDYNYDTRCISQNSNSQEFKLLSPLFDIDNFTKIMDKETYYLGEICETVIEIQNNDNYSASNLLLNDSLNDSLEFIDGSLTINNIEKNIDIFNQGLYLKELEPNKKIVIRYKSKVIDLCNKSVTNAYISYNLKNYQKHLYVNSSSFKFEILGAKLGNNNIKKSLSSYSAQIGDIITAKILIENTGNINCESLKLFESLNNSLDFIEGSLYINDIQIPEENIFNGLSISKIKANEKISISYQFKISDFPRPNPIIDKTTLTYSFMLDDTLHSNTISSPRSKLYINNPDLTIIDNNSNFKNDTSLKICHSLDDIYFNLVLENTGNVGLENINLKLNLPNELTLNIKNLKVNGCIYDKPFKDTIHLPNLNVSQKIYIDFFAKHKPSENYDLKSNFHFEYTFRDLKTRSLCKKSLKFKENIFVVNPDLEIIKFISDKYIEPDKDFVKNINLRNSGNMDLYNLQILLNENKFLKECESAIFFNGDYIPKTDIINIEKLEINESINISIRYNLSEFLCHENILNESIVNAKYYISQNNPISITRKSNKVKLEVKNYSLDVNGKSSSNTLMLDETYTYTFNIVNNGNSNCDLIDIKIDIPECFEYVYKSLYLNNHNLNIDNINIQIPLNQLKCNESINLSFSFKVNNTSCENNLSINATLNATYKGLEDSIKKIFKSNDPILSIESVDLNIVKSVSHDFLQAGDILQIQTILNNTGTLDIENILLKDNQEDNLAFKQNSVFINGENIKEVNPVKGIKISKLESYDSILITYEYEYIPRTCSTRVKHFSYVNYSSNKKINLNKNYNIKSEEIYIEGALSTFKQFNVDKEYDLKINEPNIQDVTNIFADAKIENFYEINSIKKQSYNNIKSTYRKFIIKGYIINRIEYLIEDIQSSLYMLERVEPFSVFINIPNDCIGDDLYFRAKCDDVFLKTINTRKVFISNLISIEGTL